MKQIKIKISERKKNCDIFIENDLIKKIPELLNKKYFGKKIAIVTDSNVQKLYGTALNKALIKAGFRTCLINFIAGEKNKNWLSAEKILNKFMNELVTLQQKDLYYNGYTIKTQPIETSNVRASNFLDTHNQYVRNTKQFDVLNLYLL